MTTRECKAAMVDFVQCRTRALDEIIKAARPLLPILKDHNLTNVAKDLDEKFFMLDACEQEMAEFLRRNSQIALLTIIEELERGGGL